MVSPRSRKVGIYINFPALIKSYDDSLCLVCFWLQDERSRLRVFLLAGAVLLALVVLIAARGGHQEAVQKICGSWDPSQSGSNPQVR